MREIKAPLGTEVEARVFLAGSIEMGVAEKWQDRFVREFDSDNVLFYNPRRDDWDSSWEQKIENPQFRQQVQWELDGMRDSDYIVMYFDPDTKSPITLLELGLMASSGKLIVCCPEGFWRKGNVDIVCMNYDVEMVSSFEELVEALKFKFDN